MKSFALKHHWRIVGHSPRLIFQHDQYRTLFLPFNDHPSTRQLHLIVLAHKLLEDHLTQPEIIYQVPLRDL